MNILLPNTNAYAKLYISGRIFHFVLLPATFETFHQSSAIYSAFLQHHELRHWFVQGKNKTD